MPMHSPGALRLAALVARGARRCLPLELRKRIVAGLAAHGTPGQVTIGLELLGDMARQDPMAFHRYLWANHIVYASTYDLGRFVPGALEADRYLLFELLAAELRRQGLDPARDIRSLIDVGCSSGFLLRHAETSVFPSATKFVGVDIDKHAVASGNEHLRQIGSRAELQVASMEDLDALLHGQRFDAITCCGTLMYLDEARATRVVASLLGHADRAVGLIDPAHPQQDNRELSHSGVRAIDQTWTHNLDAMVIAAGGSVASSQWRPPAESGGRGTYVVVGVPRSVAIPRADGRAADDAEAGTGEAVIDRDSPERQNR